MKPKEDFQMRQCENVCADCHLKDPQEPSARYPEAYTIMTALNPKTDSVHVVHTGVVSIWNPCLSNIYHVTGHTAI